MRRYIVYDIRLPLIYWSKGLIYGIFSNYWDMNQLRQPKFTLILPIRDWIKLKILWIKLSFKEKTYNGNILTFVVVNGNEGEGSIFGY